MIRNEQRIECLNCGHQSSLTRTTCKKCKALLRDGQGQLTAQAKIVETKNKQIAMAEDRPIRFLRMMPLLGILLFAAVAAICFALQDFVNSLT